MTDLEIGETALLINHTSMEKKTPYMASHAIFIKEEMQSPYNETNKIPDMMFRRLLSLRAFDEDGMIIDDAVVTGEAIETSIREMLENPKVEHIDAHHAGRGCFSSLIKRA